MNIRTILLSAIAVTALGTSILGIYSYNTLNTLKVNGPLYQNIVLQKDLIADVLPPPEYIIESYLVAMQLLYEPDKKAQVQLQERVTALKTEYFTRHEFWKNNLSEGVTKSKLLVESFQPAQLFYTQLEQKYLPAILAGEKDKALTILNTELKNSYQLHRNAIDEVVKLVTARLESDEKNAAAMVTSSTTILSYLVIGMVVAVLGAGLVMSAQILKPIRRTVDFVKDLHAGNGDLRQRIPVKANNEIGELAAGFNQFVGVLQGMVSEISTTSEKLAISCGGISTTLEAASQNTNQQRKETEQVATAMHEMSATVQEMARNSTLTADATQVAAKETDMGRKIMTTTLDAINNLACDFEGAATVIQTLDAESANIGAVLDVIKGVADQTNLLALNAAIEAARAGEQGRGFAVVADEVRSLASRTQQSTQEIHGMIERLQSSAKQAVQIVGKGCSSARATIDQATLVHRSFDSVAKAVNTISDMTIQIASANEQQLSVSNEINRSVMEISSAAGEVSTSIQNIAASSSDMAGLASDLQTQIQRFKV